MLNTRLRLPTFLTQFLWILLLCTFGMIFAIDLNWFDFTAYTPLELIERGLVIALCLTALLVVFCRFVSSEEFMFRNLYLWIIRMWKLIAIVVTMLIGVEGFRYLAALCVSNSGILFFVVLSASNLLGCLIALRHGKDVGRTTAQIYFIGFVSDVLFLISYLTMHDGPVVQTVYFVWRTVMIGLDFSKVLAFLSMLSLPDQPGWPTLIPFVKLKRDRVANAQYDLGMRTSVIAFVFVGAWFTWRNYAYEVFILIAPFIILIFAMRSQRHYLETKAGALPADLVRLASIADQVQHPDDRAHLIKMGVDALESVARGMVSYRQKTDAEDAAARAAPN